jgi:tRNA(Ile)-lysidine synthase
LRIRNSRPGDKFVPLGMKGHKKLKDFFIDLKISSEDRQRIPILTCQDMPIWVCGLRIDDRFKVTPDTLNILKVTLTGHWNPVAGVRPLP